MNKLLALSTIAGVMLFSGCSRSTAFDYFSTDTYYEKSISNMQKASLIRDMETKALLHAVYLNNVDSQIYKGDEYFYVAVHIIEDAYDAKKHGLKNLDYNLKMQVTSRSQLRDDKKEPLVHKELHSLVKTTTEDDKLDQQNYVEAIEIRELDEDDRLRRTMPIRNQWNHFYLVRFKENHSKKIKLKFENDRYGKALLTFEKEK